MKISTSNRSPFIFFLPFFICGWVFLSHTPDARSQAAVKSTDAPLHIVSDKMIAQKDQSMVEFTGNVKATQTDSVVLADSIKVFFVDSSKKKDAKSNVKKIISTGHVEYTAGDRKAFADKAVYTTADETLILTGTSPRLVTGSSFVTGKKITLFRNQDKVLVESDGNKRVEALFNPEDKPAEKP